VSDQPDNIVIRAHGVVNRFGAQTVHDGIDLEVRRGEVLGIVGGSGTGKSVLLRTLIGLQRPVAGQIEVLGRKSARRQRTVAAEADRERTLKTIAAEGQANGRP